jgi:hypothetical protein
MQIRYEWNLVLMTNRLKLNRIKESTRDLWYIEKFILQETQTSIFFWFIRTKLDFIWLSQSLAVWVFFVWQLIDIDMIFVMGDYLRKQGAKWSNPFGDLFFWASRLRPGIPVNVFIVHIIFIHFLHTVINAYELLKLVFGWLSDFWMFCFILWVDGNCLSLIYKWTQRWNAIIFFLTVKIDYPHWISSPLVITSILWNYFMQKSHLPISDIR